MSAKINPGIAINTSTKRLRSWSNQPPEMAATNPSEPPIANEISVVARAIPIVFRAP